MINVVAGIILDSDNKILIARRGPGKHLSGFWEFPGGKIEENEDPEDCLVREINEELNMNIEVRGYLFDSVFDYGDKVINLKGYMANHIGGDPDLIDHDRIEWVHKSELRNYEMAPADIPFVNYLENEF